MSFVRFFSVTLILAFSFVLNSNGQTVSGLGVASSAEEWTLRSENDRQVYLEGFCSGAQGTDLGRLYCGDSLKGINAKSSSAFCGQTYPSFGAIPAGKGVGFVSKFYKDASHSDVPLWAVVRYFNDKACSENQVSERISALQEKFMCLRQATNMASMGIKGDVLQAQQAKCQKLP